MMVKPVDIKEIERRAQRSFYEDGLMEIITGLFLTITGGLINGRAWGILILSVFVIFAGKRVINELKKRFIFPRIGYVSFPADEGAAKGVLKGLAIYLVLVVGSALVLILILGQERGLSFWLMHAIPALIGLVMAMGPIYAADKFGLRHWYVFAALFVISGLAVPFLNLENVYLSLTIQISGMGVIILLVGLIMFIRFLRTHPVSEEELTYDQG